MAKFKVGDVVVKWRLHGLGDFPIGTIGTIKGPPFLTSRFNGPPSEGYPTDIKLWAPREDTIKLLPPDHERSGTTTWERFKQNTGFTLDVKPIWIKETI
jgi:hypothetical protein